MAELLLATIEVDPEIEAEWAKEIDNRIRSHERGQTTARLVTEVLAKYLEK